MHSIGQSRQDILLEQLNIKHAHNGKCSHLPIFTLSQKNWDKGIKSHFLLNWASFLWLSLYRQSIFGNIVSETFKGITRIVGWGLMSLVSSPFPFVPTHFRLADQSSGSLPKRLWKSSSTRNPKWAPGQSCCRGFEQAEKSDASHKRESVQKKFFHPPSVTTSRL